MLQNMRHTHIEPLTPGELHKPNGLFRNQVPRVCNNNPNLLLKFEIRLLYVDFLQKQHQELKENSMRAR